MIVNTNIDIIVIVWYNATEYAAGVGEGFIMNESIGLKYRLAEDGMSYIVTGIGTCTDIDIVIPSEYNGKPVTVINGRAFAECDNLSTVVIPSSVKRIHLSAFVDCSSLKSVTIPEGVSRIEYGTFSRCRNLENVTIPSGVTLINRWGFFGCSNLKTITIPSSVTHIGMYAFAGCDNLSIVCYEGTEEQWKNISIGKNNGCLTNAHIVYNIDDVDDDDDFELDGLVDTGDEDLDDDIYELSDLFTDEDYEDSAMVEHKDFIYKGKSYSIEDYGVIVDNVDGTYRELCRIISSKRNDAGEVALTLRRLNGTHFHISGTQEDIETHVHGVRRNLVEPKEPQKPQQYEHPDAMSIGEGVLLYIIAMLVSSLFKGNWILWIVITIIFIVWYKGKPKFKK